MSNPSLMPYIQWGGNNMGILITASNSAVDGPRYPGQTIVCVVALFALFLIAPLSLLAQSGSSSAPPATQTQSQDQSAPCSNAPPIMKRSTQPDLPPCPVPADESPSSTGSQRIPAPNPSAPLIEKARDAAYQFSQKLPNFICEEYMTRYRQRGDDKTILDTVSTEVIYNGGHETYRNVKIGNRPTDKGMDEIGGSWSTGEFASMLLDLFSPATNAQFRSGGASPIEGLEAQVYDFRVASENSHWMVRADSQSTHPAYSGSVWIDPHTARVLRIEIQARDMPTDFPMDTVESTVDYSTVTIDGTPSLLPVHAETLGCERRSSDCGHNIIDFRNYHEFKVNFKINGVAN